MATPPDFTSGAILTAAQMNEIALWKITSCTVSSTGGTSATASNGVVTIGNGNTALVISNAFSADFDNYVIRISGGGTDANRQGYLQMGSTTANYAYQLVFGSFGNTSQAVGLTGAAQFDYSFSGNTTSLNGMIELNSPFLAERTFMQSPWIQSDTAGRTQGFLSDTTSYTSFRLSLSGGSFTGGTVRVYGYRN
jgi:hypothetical protein